MGAGAFFYAAMATVFAAVLAGVLAPLILRSRLSRLSQRETSYLWAILALLAWGLATYSIAYDRNYLVSLSPSGRVEALAFRRRLQRARGASASSIDCCSIVESSFGERLKPTTVFAFPARWCYTAAGSSSSQAR